MTINTLHVCQISPLIVFRSLKNIWLQIKEDRTESLNDDKYLLLLLFYCYLSNNKWYIFHAVFLFMYVSP